VIAPQSYDVVIIGRRHPTRQPPERRPLGG